MADVSANAYAQAGDVLGASKAAGGVANGDDWQTAHAQLLRLARKRSGLDLEEGRWLLVAFRAGSHVRMGYGSFAEYVERVLGYSPRLTHDKLRVAEALETLRAVPEALREGKLSWSAARELTRVATLKTEAEWLAAAEGRTMRDVERLVSGRPLGSRPQDPVDAEARRHLLRFDVSAETLGAFRDAIARIRRDAGGSIDEDAALMMMARRVLGGPKDEGRASYQIGLTVCEDCRRARQHAHGELIDVGGDVLEMAECDAQTLGLPPTRVDHEATAAASPSTIARAKQDVPPAMRRQVLRRDQGRCVFPGCSHATFVDLHHIIGRANGGANHADNLVIVCGAHHRAIHRGQVLLAGSASGGLRFSHVDGTPYGAASVPEPEPAANSATRVEGSHGRPLRRSDTRDPTKLRELSCRALKRMGFGEQEARHAVDLASTHVGHEGTIEHLVRRALQALTGNLAKAS
jgi:hypothetical protein